MSEGADELIGVPMHERAAAPVDPAVADAVLAAVGLPPLEAIPVVLLPVWGRPALDDETGEQPLRLHHDLKERFALPIGLMTACATTYLAPIAAGDVFRSVQVLRSVGAPRTSRLGTGRAWTIDVEHRNQADVLVGVERWTGFGYVPHAEPAAVTGSDAEPTGNAAAPSTTTLALELSETDITAVSVAAGEHGPVHVDPDAARAAGLPGVILGTTGQQVWILRALVDRFGPDAATRLQRLDLRMHRPVSAGRFTIEVTGTAASTVEVAVGVDGRRASSASVELAR